MGNQGSQAKDHIIFAIPSPSKTGRRRRELSKKSVFYKVKQLYTTVEMKNSLIHVNLNSARVILSTSSLDKKYALQDMSFFCLS